MINQEDLGRHVVDAYEIPTQMGENAHLGRSMGLIMSIPRGWRRSARSHTIFILFLAVDQIDGTWSRLWRKSRYM